MFTRMFKVDHPYNPILSLYRSRGDSEKYIQSNQFQLFCPQWVLFWRQWLYIYIYELTIIGHIPHRIRLQNSPFLCAGIIKWVSAKWMCTVWGDQVSCNRPVIWVAHSPQTTHILLVLTSIIQHKEIDCFAVYHRIFAGTKESFELT